MCHIERKPVILPTEASRRGYALPAALTWHRIAASSAVAGQQRGIFD
jgi:hypothetical protein